MSEAAPAVRAPRGLAAPLAALLLAAAAPPAEAATAIYYSVGTQVADLKVGSPTLTITAGGGTFNLAQPANVGVGDQITYNTSTIAYISGRTSATQYTVITATGGTPAPVSGATVDSILRAFNSLTAAAAGSTNGTHLGTADLAGFDYQLNWPCYNDLVMTDAVTVSGYTTGPTNYIRIYTPTTSAEVGSSQRHRGVFGTGFRLASTNVATIQVLDAHVRIEGLVIELTSTIAGSLREGIRSLPAGVSDVRISHNIVKGVISGNNNDDPTGILVGANDANVHRVSNNIVYNFNDNLRLQRGIQHVDGTAYIFNNTVFNCAIGFLKSSPADVTELRNNVSINDALNAAFQDYSFTDGLNSYNVSSDATATTYACTGCQINKTAYASYFTSTILGDENLHLRTTSLNLWGSNGANLSVDLNLAVTDDIDGAGRGRPDIGADESGPTQGPHMLVKSGRYTGNNVDGRLIFVGFEPDVVFVKREADNYDEAVRTSTMGADQTKSLADNGVVLFAGGIKSFTADGFTVGNHADVNASPPNATYHWIAFKAAPGELKVGWYPGDGVSGHVITGVGFQPDFVITLPALGGGAGIPWLRSSTMAGNEVFTVDVTGPATERILGMEPDGFRVGSDASVNQNGATIHYIAWNQVPGRMAVGKYTGNAGVASNHDEAGFAPEWVLIKRNDNSRPWVHKPASTGFSVDATNYLAGYAPPSPVAGQDINLLRPRGFQVNAGPRVNANTIAYHWIAFGPHAAGVNYRSIGPAADETTGSLTASNGSPDLTGAGTLWKTRNRGRGDVITICDNPGGGCSINVDYVVLSVTADNALRLTTPYAGTSGGGKTFVLKRQFTRPSDWVGCIDGPPGCSYFPTVSSSLVADDRSEVGILYNDDRTGDSVPDPFVPPGPSQEIAWIRGMTTDATHTITLTVDPGNRHSGVAWSGSGATPHVVLDNANNNYYAVLVQDDFVTVEWLEVKGNPLTPSASAGIGVGEGPDPITRSNGSVSSTIVVRNNLIHDVDHGLLIGHDPLLIDDSLIVDAYNNLMYRFGSGAITLWNTDQATDPSLIRIFNNTAWNCNTCITVSTNGRALLRNNIAAGASGQDFWLQGPPSALSSHNLSGDGTAGLGGASPGGGGQPNINLTCPPAPCVSFVSTAPVGSENLHLQGTSQAIGQGVNLGTVFTWDIDGAVRTGTWDIGADEFGATTAVTLQSFAATPRDGAVELSWATASELQNLGFHLYRSDAAEGPYARITASLIPGLGSSPTGQSYGYRDGGLVNGRTYYYELEDVETTGRTERHGPVSATPGASSGGTDIPPFPPGAAEMSYGDPSRAVLREVERSPRHVVLELETGGFLASPAEDGRVRLHVPGFESASRPGEPSLPMRRSFVEAASGRKVRLASVLASDELRFPGLRPVSQGTPGIEVSEEGVVLPSEEKRREGPSFKGLFPTESALLLGSVFQEETKKAEVLLFPLRWDGSGLTLSRRLRVRLEFTGVEGQETSRGGSRGRRWVERPSHARSGVVAQMAVNERGLYRVAYEDVFPPSSSRRPRGMPASSLRLSRQGESVAFHLEPSGAPFAPGSSLYFLSEGSSLNPYADAVYELETNASGLLMGEESLSPTMSRGVGEYFETVRREENRYYQAGLLEATDLWLWDVVVSPGSKSYSFTVDRLASSSSLGRLLVGLQGASDFGGVLDHHVRVRVNGVFLGETTWDGRVGKTLEAEVPPGVLQEGSNSLELQNVGDAGAAYSMVFLNRFSLSYPRRLVASQGTLEGRFKTSGQAAIEGVLATSSVLDTTDVPVWLVGASATGSGLSLPVQEGRSYFLTSRVLHPVVKRLSPSGLKSVTNQADYLLLAPAAFLEAAQPLLDLREGQGLLTKAISLEEVYEQFGHGEVSPEAIKEFLEYAYHFWATPSPRYVLLLGDASYDPKNYLGTGVKDWLPGFPVRTSYLWTVSDPAYASVNGDDLLPDIAMGRLPAGSLDEALRMVEKTLSYENGGGRLDGPAVLVADNADQAGNFEADADDIAATVLASRNPRKIYYSLEGANTRTKIHEAFDDGASLLSYIGHGSTVGWASENFFNYQDVPLLAPQPQQPLLLTLNCLNGFFHFPPLNSLSEALLKPEDKGVVAAFSPTGLSVNDPAHLFHKALLEEIVSGRHERIGDAVLAAQQAYAQTGAFPELLSIYHLFGDPALRIQ